MKKSLFVLVALVIVSFLVVGCETTTGSKSTSRPIPVTEGKGPIVSNLNLPSKLGDEFEVGFSFSAEEEVASAMIEVIPLNLPPGFPSAIQVFSSVKEESLRGKSGRAQLKFWLGSRKMVWRVRCVIYITDVKGNQSNRISAEAELR